ncbi:uncharacterized protein LOC134657211 isoform X4 [Cydia amplana]|uniref:uncharacterized protein LOC134657211 isoform X4 n=1 Tax=Cydia amplana TaxID=1869771 RepID=UPI002FE67D22
MKATVSRATTHCCIRSAMCMWTSPGQIMMTVSSHYHPMLGCIKTENGPVFQNTMLGYVVGGSIPEQGTTCNIVTNLINISDGEKLENVMEQFWLSEKLPVVEKSTNDEFMQAEKIFQDSVSLKDNRFYVDMPLAFPMEELGLGDSFSVAYNRFIMLEKRLQKDPLLFEQYKKFIDLYLELGHAKIVDIECYDLNGPVFFLGHHCVFNPSSRTSPHRVVFDGSMRSRNGTSLNQVMLNGPVVQSELFDILILFRTYPFILTCDIQKMFRNVFINEHQRGLQNILWRESPKDPINCLQLQTVTYGLKSSTFLATRALNELANMHKDQFPLAAQAIYKNTFVDDVLTGADDVETLQELKRQIVELLELGSFSLHKWCSNHAPILSDIPVEHRQIDSVEIGQNDTVKTLGLTLEINSDKLSFSCPAHDEATILNTKRKILSYIGKMFDPLGLIGPVIVVAKLFMQELHSSMRKDWDSTIPNEKFLYWSNFLNNLKQMGQIKIDRCVNFKLVSHVELVGYADASLKAFGSCLYLRVFMTDGSVQVNLLCSKSRVSPLSKSHTIPQLELSAALLLAQLASRVSKILKDRVPHKMYLYSDSQIVLWWIKTEAVKSTIYVKNRVKQIVELTENSQWLYVRSKDNPADLLSRGVEPHKLQECDLWWHGSPSLCDVNYTHTNLEEFNYDDIMTHVDSHGASLDASSNDVEGILCHTTNVEPLDLLKKYSNLNKLQRVIGFIYRFYNNCLNKDNKITSRNLTSRELRDSMLKIVRCTQAEHFSKELVLLSKNKPVTISDQLAFLDKNGVIRAVGRLQNAENLSYDKRHPTILPKNSFITDLIIEREHLRLMHAGARLVLGSLSQRHHLVNGIREVKKVVHKCIKCIRMKAEAAKQLMGDLPKERITQSRPFQHVGIDFCGPFNVKVSRIRKPIITKGYIALFVCFAVKAIHLELVSDLTAETFLACLKRFISRRGMPTNIFCDNAKTFKGASNTLKDLYDLFSSKDCRDSVNKYCSNNYITFNWIPSYSPTFGGIWESGVKSVKHHFKRIVGNLCLTYEQLNTVIIEIEGILNSRPILSAISNDCDYITPGHFICGAALTAYPEIDLTETSVNRVPFWKMCTKLKQDFWKTWSQSYLSQLQSRPKWKYQQTNLKEGDLVIVKDMNTSPLNWPMARIVKTFPGRDGLVRVADVKINNKIFRRAITKLCPLPVM